MPGQRHAAWLADRAFFPLALLGRTRTFSRARQLTWPALLGLYRDCLMNGALPLEAHVWRGLYGSGGLLPARAAALLMMRLGDPAERRLLADKLTAAQRLAGTGAAFPILRAVWRQGEPIALPNAASAAADLFVKPRHGHGGQGCLALSPVDDAWFVDGRPVPALRLHAMLERLSGADDLLVQDRLAAHPDLADLVADGRPPVLRLATARLPGEVPFLHSALLTIGVAGQDLRNFLYGAIHAPVDSADGRLRPGLSLAQPSRRIDHLDGPGTPLAGRTVPDFAVAVAMVLRAMAVLPGTPLVHWDVVPTAQGPVVLEGNSSGNWILANLPALDGLQACPLPPLLAHWLPQGAGR